MKKLGKRFLKARKAFAKTLGFEVEWLTFERNHNG